MVPFFFLSGIRIVHGSNLLPYRQSPHLLVRRSRGAGVPRGGRELERPRQEKRTASRLRLRTRILDHAVRDSRRPHRVHLREPGHLPGAPDRDDPTGQGRSDFLRLILRRSRLRHSSGPRAQGAGNEARGLHGHRDADRPRDRPYRLFHKRMLLRLGDIGAMGCLHAGRGPASNTAL